MSPKVAPGLTAAMPAIMDSWVTSIRRWAMGDFADGKHTAGVAVEAVLFDGQVDVDDVAFFERFVVGNAAADDVVDGVQQDLG